MGLIRRQFSNFNTFLGIRYYVTYIGILFSTKKPNFHINFTIYQNLWSQEINELHKTTQKCKHNLIFLKFSLTAEGHANQSINFEQ